MKKLIIILMGFTLIFLSGCGICNLTNFTIPDDIKFMETVEKLSTPQEISDYMVENFTYKANPFSAISPYQLYTGRVGDCNDFTSFATYVANYHGYETWQILIFYKDFKHQVAVCSEYNCFSFIDQYYHCCFSKFSDIVNFDSEGRSIDWIKYIVYDYNNNIIETGYNE